MFGHCDSGAYLSRFARTKIVRHPMVRGTSSTDDPALTEYWAARRRRGIPRPIDTATLRLLQSQHGRCPAAGSSSSTLTARRKAHVSGSNGWRPPARR